MVRTFLLFHEKLWKTAKYLRVHYLPYRCHITLKYQYTFETIDIK
jgi:hypothetical protein